MGLLSSALNLMRINVRGSEVIAGRMTTAGASDPTKVAPSIGWTAKRTAAGQITVTLPQAYKSILFASADLLVATGATKQVQMISTSNGGIRAGATVVFELQNTAGTAADQTGLDLMFYIVASQNK